MFEFPLNERMRVFLRLEQLFKQISYFMDKSSIWDSRAAVTMLLDVLTIFTRNDLKSEILKELERHSGVLARIARSQNVDQSKLQQLRDQLEYITHTLYSTSGKIGLGLMENELFKSIAQRTSIPGGTCGFDLPEYHYWLEQDEQTRQQDLIEWTRPFMIIRDAVDLILGFIRQSAVPSQENAEAGYFQQSLDRSVPYQLVSVSYPASLPYFAEISGGKHRFSIRFMTVDQNSRSIQASTDIPFWLTQCVF